MAQSEFKKVMIKDVQLVYPRLDQTYQYDNINGGSKPCVATAGGAKWSVSFVVSSEKAQQLWKEAQAWFAECKSLNPTKLSDKQFKTIFGMKKRDDGTVLFRAQRKGANNEGKENKPPKVMDWNMEELKDKAIWTGSVGNIRMWAYPNNSPNTGEWGISYWLDTVQVYKPEYGSEEDQENPDFEKMKNPNGDQPPSQSVNDDFSKVAAPQQTTETVMFGDMETTVETGSNSVANDFDDEIPF